MSRNPNPFQPQQPAPQAPDPLPVPLAPEPRRRFRWWLLALPATCLAYAWLVGGVVAGISLAGIAAALGAADVARYGMLAILGIVLVTFVLLYKTWLRR